MYILGAIGFCMILRLSPVAFAQEEAVYTVDASIRKAVDVADQKRTEAQRKAGLINDYYNKGKAAFDARAYKKAVGYFEDILDMDPNYEPAHLYLESALIHMEILKEQEEISSIKLKMADIIAQYDRRRERTDSLAVKYFLEQAQYKCQTGDFKGAEEFYTLCYKVYPYSREQVEWFVKATYDLTKLSQSLNEHSRKIEELAAFE